VHEGVKVDIERHQ